MTESANVPAVRQQAEPAQPPKARVDLSGPITDLDAMWRIATLLSNSTMVPEALRNRPGNCLVLCVTGQELGLTWNQAIRAIYVTKGGQPGLRGELLLVKLREKGHDYTYVEESDGCTFTLHRSHEAPVKEGEVCTGGRHYTASFTLDDALRAGLVKRTDSGEIVARSQRGEKLPWEQYAKDLYFWRSVARTVRRGAPEVAYGFSVAGIEAVDGPAPVGDGTPHPVIQGEAEPVTPEPTQQDVDAALVEVDAQSAAEMQSAPPAAPLAEAMGLGDDPALAAQRAEVAGPDPTPPAPADTPSEGPDPTSATSSSAAQVPSPQETTPPSPSSEDGSPPTPAGRAGLKTITDALAPMGCTDKDEKLHTCSVIRRHWMEKPSDILSSDVGPILDVLNEIRAWAATNKLDVHEYLFGEVERLRKLWEIDSPDDFPPVEGTVVP